MSVAKRPRLSVSNNLQPSLLLLVQERTKGEQITLTWGALPLELVVQIINYLNVKERQAVSLVCKQWYFAFNVPHLWKNSWISFKQGLGSRPMEFWSLLKQRNINNICVHGSSFHKDLVLVHNHLPNLHGLEISLAQHSKHFLEFANISCFQKLKTLRLEFTASFTSSKWITSVNLSKLCSLTECTLSGVTDLTLHNLSFLAHPYLQTLTLKNCGSFRAINTNKIIGHLPNLQKLYIQGCVYYHAFVLKDTISSKMNQKEWCTSITHLDLARTSFDGLLTEFPLRFTHLVSLNLLLCQQSSSQLEAMLPPLVHLQELHLRGNTCTDTVLASLQCRQLQTIDLALNHDITLYSIVILSKLAPDTLSYLGLAFCSGVMLSQKYLFNNLNSMFLISLLPSLKTIDLLGWRLTKHQIQSLMSSNQLREIILSRTSINYTPSLTDGQTVIRYVT